MGYTGGIKAATPFAERLEASTIPVPWSGCWIWMRGLDTNGYGRFHASDAEGHQPTQRSAHRESYKHFIGPIPDDLQLDHLCRVRCCVNPAHLEPVTGAENFTRGNGTLHQRLKTHCPKGHPYEPWNLRADVRRGKRACLTCHRLREAAKRKPKPAKPRAAKTHCPHGHPYEAWNVRVHKKGYKLCLTCEQIYRQQSKGKHSNGYEAPKSRSAA